MSYLGHQGKYLGAKRRTNLPKRIAFAHKSTAMPYSLNVYSKYRFHHNSSASLSTCLKWKTKNKYKQINNFIVKKNFSQMSACRCNHSNESVNKSTRRKDLFGAKNPFSDGENLSGSQWIVLPQNIS